MAAFNWFCRSNSTRRSPGFTSVPLGVELRDDQRVAAGSGGADEAGRCDVVKTDGFDQAVHSQRLDERAARDLERGGSLRRVLVLIGGTPRADAAHDGKPAHQDQRNENECQVGPFHRV